MKTVRAWWIPAEDSGPEREYLWPYINRELGIRLFYGGDQRAIQLARVNNGQKAIFFVDSSVKNFDFLDHFPAKSAIVFFVSNETYSAWAAIRILLKPSTIKIFRDYPIGNFSRLIHYPTLLIQAIREKITYKVPAKFFYLAFFAGLIMTSKQFCMESISALMRKRVDWIPLGYTLRFSEIYAQRFNLEKGTSILKHSLEIVFDNIEYEKKSNTFFSGQLGGFDRQVMIKAAQVGGLIVGPIFEQFGGPLHSSSKKKAEENYFLGLLKSRFSICPPGNYSAESFRYLESLILHSYPLLKTRVLSDPLSTLHQRINFERYVLHPNSRGEISTREEIKEKLVEIRESVLQIHRELTLPTR